MAVFHDVDLAKKRGEIVNPALDYDAMSSAPTHSSPALGNSPGYVASNFSSSASSAGGGGGFLLILLIIGYLINDWTGVKYVALGIGALALVGLVGFLCLAVLSGTIYVIGKLFSFVFSWKGVILILLALGICFAVGLQEESSSGNGLRAQTPGIKKAPSPSRQQQYEKYGRRPESTTGQGSPERRL